MTPEQEAQQAQTVADIEQRHGWLVLTYDNETQPGDGLEAHEDRGRLLEIVDSQAQKIAEQAKEIERLETTYDLIPLDAEQQRLRS